MSIKTKELFVDLENGKLEAILDLPQEPSDIEKSEYLAVCCHPHSLHGGTFTNKVVYTLSRAFASKGIPSIRFNFRGVGNSDGEYDEGVGEQDDLGEIVNWMMKQYPNKKLILGGFSFGAFVSIMAANQLQAEKLISVAPPVGRFDFSAMQNPVCPWFVIQGDEDELVKCNDVENWANKQGSSLKFIKITGASHFFHGKLIELRTTIEKIVNLELNCLS